jgi:arsenite methyltransferase
VTALQYDKDATERLLAVYVTPDVIAQRHEFLRAFGPRPGERVLDVGSGPGFLAAAIAEAVGPSGRVCGIDISEPLLAAAQSHCAHQPWVEFRHGDATQLPFPDHAFDAVVSTQVLEYVSDVDAALVEFRRVVRPGGRVGILDTDWDSLVWHSPNQELMSRVLAAWNEHANDPHLPRTLARRLRRAGFSTEARQILPLFNPDYDANTYSNRVIDLIASFVVGRGSITHDEAAAWARQLRQSGEQGEYFFSLNRYVFLARRPQEDPTSQALGVG